MTEIQAERARHDRVELWAQYEYRRRSDLKVNIDTRQKPVVENLLKDAQKAVHRAIDATRLSAADQITEQNVLPLNRKMSDLEERSDAALRPPVGVIAVPIDDHATLNNDYVPVVPGGVTTDNLSALTGTADPAPVEWSRAYDEPGGHRRPMEYDQFEVERHVPRDPHGRPRRMPDPYEAGPVRRPSRWFGRMNDSGPGADPTRGINCVDCVLSLFDTWFHGRPRVSAPRTFDAYRDGDVRQPVGGQRGGLQRAARLLGTSFTTTYSQDMAITHSPQQAYQASIARLEQTLLDSGPGTFAMISHEWRAGGSHTWAAFNHEGEIVYADPQQALLSPRPLYDTQGHYGLIRMDLAIVDGGGNPVHVTSDSPHTPWRGGDPTGDIDPSRPDPRLMPQRQPEGHVNPRPYPAAHPLAHPNSAVLAPDSPPPEQDSAPPAQDSAPPAQDSAPLASDSAPLASDSAPLASDSAPVASDSAARPGPATVAPDRAAQPDSRPGTSSAAPTPPGPAATGHVDSDPSERTAPATPTTTATSPAATQAPAHATVDIWRQLERPGRARQAALTAAARIGGSIEADPAKLAAIADAYTVVSENIAPMAVKVAMDMLVDFRQQVAANPDHKIVFVGRDGDALGLVIKELDPAFFADHCRMVTIPRSMCMLAILDMEVELSISQLIPDAYRWDFDGNTPNVQGAARELERHLRERGVPLEPGSAVTLVDSSFKGTIQEMLAALHPDVAFQGAYIWHGPQPSDPHPGTKRGYLQHVTDGGRGNIWETVAYEYSMRGSLSSPSGYGPDGEPTQIPIREESNPLHPLRRNVIARRYQDPHVRDAIMEANRLAVIDLARRVALGADSEADLERGVEAFREGTRSWRHDASPTTSPAFLTYLDSFVVGGRRRGP